MHWSIVLLCAQSSKLSSEAAYPSVSAMMLDNNELDVLHVVPVTTPHWRSLLGGGCLRSKNSLRNQQSIRTAQTPLGLPGSKVFYGRIRDSRSEKEVMSRHDLAQPGTAQQREDSWSLCKVSQDASLGAALGWGFSWLDVIAMLYPLPAIIIGL